MKTKSVLFRRVVDGTDLTNYLLDNHNSDIIVYRVGIHHYHHHHHHLSLNREGRWGTKDDFTTNFLHFSLFSIAHRDLANSRPVHSLVLSSHLFSVCLVFFPLSLCLARWIWPDLMNGKHVHTTTVCVSLRWSGVFVWSDCLLELGTDFLVGNTVFV